jgi:cellulose 1,4-beta-cellobiosidase
MQATDPPATPANPDVVLGNGQNALVWSPGTGSDFAAAGYYVYWTGDGSVPTKETPGRLSCSATTCVHTGLRNGTIYSYCVTAWNAAGESAESAVVRGAPVDAPSPVDGFPWVQSGMSQAQVVGFLGNPTDITSYEVSGITYATWYWISWNASIGDYDYYISVSLENGIVTGKSSG